MATAGPATTERLAARPSAGPLGRIGVERVAVRSGQLALALFFAVQAAVVLSRPTGPFLDESIYIVAGRRTLEGHAQADAYLTWFAGSLIWPILAGAANAVAGLEGARLLAAALVTLGVWGAMRAASLLFDEHARPWTVVAALLSGATVQLAHLAVYDALAYGAVGIALASVCMLGRTGDHQWALAAGVALALATLAKYPVLVFGGVPVVGLLIALRGRRSVFDLGLMAFTGGAVLLLFFLPARGQMAEFLSFRAAQNPSFGVTTGMIAYQYVYFLAIPMGLAVAGWAVSGRLRRTTAPLLLGPIAPALYHLAGHTAVGLEKHAAIALLPALPLAGLALDRAWRSRRIGRVALVLGLVGLAGFSALQVVRLDRSWLDVRPVAAYLQDHVKRGEIVLADTSWSYAQYLYPQRLGTPDDAYDVYRLANDPPPGGVCSATWFVGAGGVGSWPASVRRDVARCGTFRRVYVQDPRVEIGLGRDLRFFRYPLSVAVYRNASPRP